MKTTKPLVVCFLMLMFLLLSTACKNNNTALPETDDKMQKNESEEMNLLETDLSESNDEKQQNNSKETNSAENDKESTEKDINTELANNILSHIDEWEYICDSFTQKYTYDDVESTMMMLYSANTEGKYYLGIVYAVKKSSNSAIAYQRMYYVTDSSFKYLYSSDVLDGDEITEKSKLLSHVFFSSTGSNKDESVKQLAYSGLEAEKEYLGEITLDFDDTIVLTKEQQQLFENMYDAIKELEYYDNRSSGYSPSVPLAKIKYYVLGDGKCEVLLYHGSTSEYGGSYYVGGYSIDNQGYSRLSSSDEEKLKNTSKMITLNWNVQWTEEKKIYMLKKSIFENS